jgi:hypothetical protein
MDVSVDPFDTSTTYNQQYLEYFVICGARCINKLRFSIVDQLGNPFTPAHPFSIIADIDFRTNSDNAVMEERLREAVDYLQLLWLKEPPCPQISVSEK